MNPAVLTKTGAQEHNKYTKSAGGAQLGPVAVSALAVMALIRSSQQTSSPLVLLCLLLRGSPEWCRDFPTTLMGADTELSSPVFTTHYDSKAPLGRQSQIQSHELGAEAQVSYPMLSRVLSVIAEQKSQYWS